jgi:anti-sigma factor RsiW
MPSLSDKDREDLSAFLDGELDEQRARALEAKITVDPRTRAEVEALRQAWDLLEYLPRPEPSAHFTHRTLERLAVPRCQWAAQYARGRRWRLCLGWAAVVLLTAGLGFGVARWLWPPPAPIANPMDAEVDQQLVQHLRLLQNKPLYDLVDDVDQLQALDHPDLFGEDNGS